jgi:hypothetical protein
VTGTQKSQRCRAFDQIASPVCVPEPPLPFSPCLLTFPPAAPAIALRQLPRPSALAAAARPPQERLLLPSGRRTPGLPAVLRRVLGALARPWSGTDIGASMAMMNTQSAIQRAAGSTASYDTFAATADTGRRARSAAYGYYGADGNWRRH